VSKGGFEIDTISEVKFELSRLLNNYRKKSERNGNYKEAKNSKKKIELIR